MLRALGMKRKLKLGPWFRPVFATLRAMRKVRGTPLNVFGLPEVRRVERRLPGEYRELVGRALEHLAPDTHATVAKVAELPDLIRGYEDIKLRNVERYREQAARLEAQLADRTS